MSIRKIAEVVDAVLIPVIINLSILKILNNLRCVTISVRVWRHTFCAIELTLFYFCDAISSTIRRQAQ